MRARRKTLRVAVPAAARPDINVTPLVDVVLVLLIIFMVIVPLVERSLAVATPPLQETEAPEAPDDQLVLEVLPDGSVRLNQEPVTVDQLDARLKVALARRKDKVVFFTAADAANFERAVAVLDAAKAAGAKTIGLLTEPTASQAAIQGEVGKVP
jgi:biopolymer transport protein ExbD